MHQLIKYIKNWSYAQKFIDGHLYMNSISYFWEHGFDSQQDMLEGISETVDKKAIGIPPSFRQLIVGDMMFQLNAYQYCNLLCFYRVDLEAGINAGNPLGLTAPTGSKTIQLPDRNMDDFGAFVAIVHDEKEFMRRVLNAIPDKWLCVAGDVRYHKTTGSTNGRDGSTLWKTEPIYPAERFISKNVISSRRDCFNKTISFSNQREWRICLFRNQKDKSAYTLEVGDLSDIIEFVPSKQIQQRLMEIHRPCIPGIVAPQYSGYSGNTTRNSFKESMYQFDGGMGSLVAIM